MHSVPDAWQKVMSQLRFWQAIFLFVGFSIVCGCQSYENKRPNSYSYRRFDTLKGEGVPQDPTRARELSASAGEGDGDKQVSSFDKGSLPSKPDELNGNHVDQTLTSTDQQNLNVALALIAAPFAIEALADAGIIEELADIVAAVGEVAANAEINSIIEEKVKSTFPNETPDSKMLLTSVLDNVCTGHPSIRDIASNFTESEFNEWVAERSPEAAKNVRLLEILYEVYKRVHSS